MAQENVVFGLRTFEMMMMFITMLAKCRLKLEGETENMGVWTKKRGSMNTVVLMASSSETPPVEEPTDVCNM